MFFLLQALPNKDSLNPDIALWIIGTLILVILSGVALFKWAFNTVISAAKSGWSRFEEKHDEAMSHLSEMKGIQIKFEQKQDVMNQQIQEIRYSQLNMAKVVTEIKVKPGGIEEILNLEEELKKRKKKRQELEGA
jgi:hypothetical protein